MRESEVLDGGSDNASHGRPDLFLSNARGYELFKRAFDVVGSIALILVCLPSAAVLLILNPFLNPGPLIYSQIRMGQYCRPFRVYKFRTMLPVADVRRSATDGIESDRITPFGKFLRRARLDELPQIVNVLKGEMSLIGPRPDFFEHACEYLDLVPGYRARHGVKPGITGLAQIEIGYAADLDTVAKKVATDLRYIRQRSVRMDVWIALRTVAIVLGRRGH
jgi:lipopolysaccharide/colanic/teichoic acid biosynthesis glycosyltransferase